MKNWLIITAVVVIAIIFFAVIRMTQPVVVVEFVNDTHRYHYMGEKPKDFNLRKYLEKHPEDIVGISPGYATHEIIEVWSDSLPDKNFFKNKWRWK